MSDSISTLEQQIAELQAKKQALIDAERDTKIAEVKKIVQQYGITASELGLTVKGKKPKSQLMVKYVNPENPNETWHGARGAKPQWVKEYLERGGKLEDIEVEKPFKA